MFNLKQCVLWLTVAGSAAACTLAAPAPPTPQPSPTTVFTPVPTVTLTPTPVVSPTPAPPTSLPPTATPQAAANGAAASGALAGFGAVGNQLYLWEAPDNLSAVLRMVTADDGNYTPVGRTENRQWVQVELDDGEQGWFVAAALDEIDDLSALPVTGEASVTERVVLVPADSPERTLYTDEGDTDTLARLQPVTVDARTIDDQWLHVVAPSGERGWLSADGVEIPFDLAAVEVREFTEPVTYQAAVQPDAGGLRLRQLPSTDGNILFNLQAEAPLEVQGRTQDSAWVLVELREGYTGWTSAAYLDYEDPLNAVPVITNPEPAPYVEPDIPEGAPNVSIVRAPSVNLAANPAPNAAPANPGAAPSVGGANRRNVFTTVGDSITDTPYFLRHIVNGYNLRDYGYLLPTIQYFNINTGDGNAFARRAASTKAGWSTLSLFEPLSDGRCQPNENALACEYRLTRPGVALIMMGTNDAPGHSGSQYRAQMEEILDITLNNGVVPILSTLPPRGDQFNSRINEYNTIIKQLSAQYNTPLIDLHSALIELPNSGLAPDGVHLSLPPGGTAATMDFTAENLRYGTTMRNLTALQTLHQVRQQLGG